jgi:hypothetical protein
MPVENAALRSAGRGLPKEQGAGNPGGSCLEVALPPYTRSLPELALPVRACAYLLRPKNAAFLARAKRTESSATWA